MQLDKQEKEDKNEDKELSNGNLALSNGNTVHEPTLNGQTGGLLKQQK